MDTPRHIDPAVAQGLDACRPDSTDLSLPEMQAARNSLADDRHLRALHERLLEADRRIGRAIRNVTVPAGLEQRLLAALEETQQPPSRRTRRRWFVTAAAGLACAASLVAGFFLWPKAAAEYGSETILEFARAFYRSQAAPTWQRLADAAPPQAYSWGNQVRANWVTGWHRLKERFLARDGVAYRLEGPRQTVATLLVVDLDGPLAAPHLLVSTTSPTQHMLTTDGLTSSTWTDGTRLYVLVAEGDEAVFRRFVRETPSMA